MQRRLAGRVISRFEDKGFNIIAMKMLQVTPELARQHYAEHVNKPFYPGLEAFITGSPMSSKASKQFALCATCWGRRTD